LSTSGGAAANQIFLRFAQFDFNAVPRYGFRFICLQLTHWRAVSQDRVATWPAELLEI